MAQIENNPTNSGNNSKVPVRNTIIGKHQLIIAIAGEKEIASQLFNYDQIREIRVSLKEFDVKLLMTYDQALFRVFSVVPKGNSEEDRKQAEQTVVKFYNDLLNATMKFTKEDLELIKKKQEELKANQSQTTKTGN